jgi:hypothetical protein
MDRFFGKAVLEFAGRKEEVSLCINLLDNVFEARFPMDMKEAFKLSFGKSDWMTQDLRLTDIEIKLPHGRLVKDIYDDFFIEEYKPGTFSTYTSELSRSLNLRGEELGITILVLTPRTSGITFDFKKPSYNANQYELFYTNNKLRVDPQTCLEVDSLRIRFAGDKNGLTLIAESSLREVQEKFWLSWSILQGTPLHLRAILDADELTLNMSSCKFTSGIGSLPVKESDVLPLFNAYNVFFRQMSIEEFSRWRRAAHFYFEGVATDRYLEIRLINLFNFLEMLDDSKTLNKSTLAPLLSVTNNEADILCKIRNSLVHKGKTLEDAISTAFQDFEQYGANQVAPKLFGISRNNLNKIAALFYFKFAACLARFWARKINYNGDVYGYENTINNLESPRLKTSQ